jgi:alpha-beta hydrolase superfamily lysophospholipase
MITTASADGTTIRAALANAVAARGWLYAAEASPAPAVVMAHGFSAVKEMYLDSFAEVFNGAGLNVLVFDNRNFGASDGEPRLEIGPWAQVRDYRHAITFASTLPRSTPHGSGSGGAVTPEATSWWSPRSTAG